MTGPPVNPADDARMVSRFEATEGTHVICGGTTAQIYARETGKKIFSDFKYVNKKIPPTSRIEGVDLVTEGIITLSAVMNLLEDPGAAKQRRRRPPFSLRRSWKATASSSSRAWPLTSP